MPQKFLIVFAAALVLMGCSTRSTTGAWKCPEPVARIKTNADLAEAYLELKSAIRTCNALYGQE